jgi:uncharacterized protein YfaS (alpha-2-macroglobulin family)
VEVQIFDPNGNLIHIGKSNPNNAGYKRYVYDYSIQGDALPGTYRIHVSLQDPIAPSILQGIEGEGQFTVVTTCIIRLSLNLDVDKLSYAPGEVVTLTAMVKEELICPITTSTAEFQPLPGVEVVFEVRNPLGSVIASGSAATGADGVARKSFTLPQDAMVGVYSAYASTTYHGLSASNNVRFSVTRGFHVSLTLSTTDPDGNPKSEFRRGEAVAAKITVRNDGGARIGGAHILATFYDSNNVPVSFSFDILDLGVGEERTSIKGFTLSPSAAIGTYRVEVIVLTDFLANGGVYIPDGNGSSEFQVAT